VARENYLHLLAEEKRIGGERHKLIKRLDLLEKLLALEGKKVNVPVITSRKRRAA
jgi:hypothetical protein